MLRTGPNGAKTGIGLNITNLFDPDAVFPSMRSRGYATAIFATYCAGEWFYNRITGKGGGHGHH